MSINLDYTQKPLAFSSSTEERMSTLPSKIWNSICVFFGDKDLCKVSLLSSAFRDKTRELRIQRCCIEQLKAHTKWKEISFGPLEGKEAVELKKCIDRNTVLRQIAELAKVKLEKASKISEEVFKQVDAFSKLLENNLQVKEIRSLDLKDKKLTFIPPEIFNLLPDLEILKLGSNQLPELPPEIQNLKKLKWLHLGRNRISSLPKEIANLDSLEELHLEKNLLKELPPELSEHKNLKWLWLDRNHLTHIPEGFDKQNRQFIELSLRKNYIPEKEKKRLESVFGERVVGLESQRSLLTRAINR